MDETVQVYAKRCSKTFHTFPSYEMMLKFPECLTFVPPDDYYNKKHSDTISDFTSSSEDSEGKTSEEESDEESGYSDWEDAFPYEENVMALSRTYQFIDRLSTNDQAVVYKAYHKDMKKKVIVKIINEPVKMKHPKIIRLMTVVQKCPYLPKMICWHDLQSTGCYAITTRYISGKEIDYYCDGNEKKIHRTMHELCKAIEYLHNNNIIHRDVKPGNILCNDKMTVLIDFDLSTFYDPVRLHRCKAGTKGFRAPEVGNCKGYGKSIDIFSLGMVFSALLLKLKDREITSDNPKMTPKKIRKIAREKKGPAYKLLLKLLCNNPADRPTIQEILTHPYFSSP